MPNKKKVASQEVKIVEPAKVHNTKIDEFLEESRKEPKREITQELAIIRDLVAIIRANLPGREYTSLARAERYLKELEPAQDE